METWPSNSVSGYLTLHIISSCNVVSFDIVVMDWHFPVRDSVALCPQSEVDCFVPRLSHWCGSNIKWPLPSCLSPKEELAEGVEEVCSECFGHNVGHLAFGLYVVEQDLLPLHRLPEEGNPRSDRGGIEQDAPWMK